MRPPTGFLWVRACAKPRWVFSRIMETHSCAITAMLPKVASPIGVDMPTFRNGSVRLLIHTPRIPSSRIISMAIRSSSATRSKTRMTSVSLGFNCALRDPPRLHSVPARFATVDKYLIGPGRAQLSRLRLRVLLARIQRLPYQKRYTAWLCNFLVLKDVCESSRWGCLTLSVSESEVLSTSVHSQQHCRP